MDRKVVVEELQAEEKKLVEELGNVRMALRGFGVGLESEESDIVTRQRVHITQEMKEKYQREVVKVLESYGPSTTRELQERGNFEDLSRTSVYKMARTHPRVHTGVRGRTILFSIRRG